MSKREICQKPDEATALRQHHIRLGWCLLALFATLGLILESLHGLKLQWYVGVMQSTRREMWTLAHAHGTLLAILNLGFATSLSALPAFVDGRRFASWLLWIASICMPLGFFLGGTSFREGDPGLGILFVPVGAICLILCALLIGFSRRHPAPDAAPQESQPSSP